MVNLSAHKSYYTCCAWFLGKECLEKNDYDMKYYYNAMSLYYITSLVERSKGLKETLNY